MQKLKIIATQRIFDCIARWKVEKMDDSHMETALQSIAYFDKMKVNDREQILVNLNSRDHWNKNIRHQEAWDVALFIHDEQKEIILEFESHNFDLEFLFNVCGPKLKNLKELEMPKECKLTANACRQMREALPNLDTLHVGNCTIDLNAATFIAQLPLVALYADGNLERFVRKVCEDEDAIIRQTLEVFHLSTLHMPAECIRLVLNTMELVKDLGLDDCKWLKALSLIDTREYNVRQLKFRSTLTETEQELEIAVVKCPKVSVIDVTCDNFTPRILLELTNFAELSRLHVNMHFFRGGKVEEFVFDAAVFEHLRFDSLVELHLNEISDGWMSSGYLFHVLDICSRLEKLLFYHCCGFDDEFVGRLAAVLANMNVKTLVVEECNALGSFGIEGLLQIGSLFELDVDYGSDVMDMDDLDVDWLQEKAKLHEVKLRLAFTEPFDDESD